MEIYVDGDQLILVVQGYETSLGESSKAGSDKENSDKESSDEELLYQMLLKTVHSAIK